MLLSAIFSSRKYSPINRNVWLQDTVEYTAVPAMRYAQTLNPEAGKNGYRSSQRYHELCDLLWREMHDEPA